MTLSSILIVFTGFIFVSHRGMKTAILHPFTWICFTYLRFFTFPTKEEDMAVLTDVAVMVSFVVLAVSLFITQQFFGTSWARSRLDWLWPTTALPGNRRTQTNRAKLFYLSLLPFFYFGYSLFIATIEYGSVSEALVRFYAKAPIESVFPAAKALVNVLLGLSCFAILIIRIEYGLSNIAFLRVMFWVGTLPILAGLFSSGSAGSLLAPFYVLVLADTISAYRRQRPFAIKIDGPLLASVAIFLATIQFSVRGYDFESPQQFVQFVTGSLDSTIESGRHNVEVAHTGIIDEIAYCLRTYGDEKEFYFLHSPYCLLANPIPREIWGSKPIGFGRILAIDQGYQSAANHTVAAGIAGEGYANGGFFGIFLIAAMVGIISGICSSLALAGLVDTRLPHVLIGLLAWFVPMAFVRGDMLNAWASAVYPLGGAILLLLMINRGLETSSATRIDRPSPVPARW